MKHTLDEARNLDAHDPFPCLKNLFDMPRDEKGREAIYLNGNSLGPKPKTIDQALQKECEAWGKLGVRGHFDKENPWVLTNERVTNSLVRLVGAKLDEVVAVGTLTGNLHFLFTSFYRPTPTRYKIIRLQGFPSDTYAITSQVKQRLETLHAFQDNLPYKIEDAIIEIKPNASGYIDLATFEKVLDQHGESTAIVWIEAVHYLTGQFFDIPALAKLAHSKGCQFGLDLAHAIGNIPLSLHDWDVDFAVWCSYKYLSAGPGAIAGLYVHEKYLNDPSLTRFAGWWGHNKKTRFQMNDIFDPIPSAEAWQVSNPSVFLSTTLKQALDVFDQVDLHALREKNIRLGAYLENLIRDELGETIEIITPKNPVERGCQLSLRFKSADENTNMAEILFQQGIICDARKDLVRVAPMGLYTQFVDVFNFVEKLKLILVK